MRIEHALGVFSKTFDFREAVHGICYKLFKFYLKMAMLAVFLHGIKNFKISLNFYMLNTEE